MTQGHVATARRERLALADLLEGLTPDQWRAPSLCAGWSVRDVAVHTVGYDALSTAGLLRAFVRGRLSVDAINEQVIRQHDALTDGEVIDLVRSSATPHGLTAALGGMIAVTDGTIHQQDIRRALDLPREIDGAQLVSVLDFALKAPTLPARRHARGLRLVADDIGWSHGSGAEVRGSGEALLMAVAGRPAALTDLGGEGVDLLVARVDQR